MTTPEHIEVDADMLVQVADIATRSGFSSEQVSGANILITADYFRQISSAHHITFESVQVQLPNKNENGYWINGTSPDLYVEQNGKLAPTAFLLGKVERKAGVRWHMGLTGPTKETPDYMAYRAVGAIRGLNGEWTYVEKMREWHREAELIDIEERAEEIREVGYGRNKRAATDADRAKYVRKEIARSLRFRVAMLDTKTKNRVIKALLGLPASSDEEYWKRPLLVPRISVRLDPSNPDVQRMLLEDAHGAGRLLGYDPVPPQPAHATAHEPLQLAQHTEPEPQEPGELSEPALASAHAKMDALLPMPQPDAEPVKASTTADIPATIEVAGDAVITTPGEYQGASIDWAWSSGEEGQAVVRKLRGMPDGRNDSLRAAARLWVEAKETDNATD